MKDKIKGVQRRVPTQTSATSGTSGTSATCESKLLALEEVISSIWHCFGFQAKDRKLVQTSSGTKDYLSLEQIT